MKFIIKIVLLFLMAQSASVMAQGSSATKEEKKNDVANARAKRKKAKTEWKETRSKEQADHKSVRRQEKRLQTKETRKRMKRNRKKANQNNQHKKDFFLIRLFKPKPKTGGW